MTAFILLLAFPPLEAAGIMQLMDRVAGTSFFLPTGLAVGGSLANVSGGGSPLLWLPTYSETGQEVCRALEALFKQHGAPMVLKMDNGSGFDNQEVKEFFLGLSEIGKRKSNREVKHYKRRKRWLG